MSVKKLLQRGFLLQLGFVLVCVAALFPTSASGYGYGEGYYYGQAYYYGQGYYYAQSGYGVTLTKAATIAGSVTITGSVTKNAGSFVIDHPLDPKNTLLVHSFVESPDVKNIYDGIATLDEDGSAIIELPSYFLALNGDFRYLATAIGAPMPDLHISSKIKRRYWFFGPATFQISGGSAAGRVSWQVTGIRHDPYILANPVIVEVDKGPGELVNKDECIFEPLCQ